MSAWLSPTLWVSIAAAGFTFWQAAIARGARRDATVERKEARAAAQTAREAEQGALEAAQRSADATSRIAELMTPKRDWQLRWVDNGGSEQELVNLTGHRVEAVLFAADPDSDHEVRIDVRDPHPVEPGASVRFTLQRPEIWKPDGTFGLTLAWSFPGRDELTEVPVTAYYDRSHIYE